MFNLDPGVLIGSMLMQVTGNPQIAAIGQIITDIAIIAGVIGTALTMFTKFQKQGQLVTAFAQKTAEQEGNFVRIGNAITTISPEAAAELAKVGVPLEYLKERADIAASQFKILAEPLPEREQADSKKDLPREKAATFRG